jgi:hypothetical protein
MTPNNDSVNSSFWVNVKSVVRELTRTSSKMIGEVNANDLISCDLLELNLLFCLFMFAVPVLVMNLTVRKLFDFLCVTFI